MTFGCNKASLSVTLDQASEKSTLRVQKKQHRVSVSYRRLPENIVRNVVPHFSSNITVVSNSLATNDYLFKYFLRMFFLVLNLKKNTVTS